MDARKMSFSKEDFICPITQAIFFDPVSASPCGHPFERAALTKYLQKNDRCPYCKKEINEISEVPPLFRDVLEQALLNNIAWEQNQYFSIELFKYELGRMEDDDSKSRMNKIIRYLAKYPDLLNEPDTSEKSTNLLYEIAAKHGVELFANYPLLLAIISEKGLNSICTDGNAPITWFAGIPEYREPLFSNKNFIKKINSQGLNTIDRQDNDSTAFWLMSNSSYIFADNPDLLNMIDAKGLNTIAYQPDLNRGTSALYWLIKHDYQLLRQNQHLRNLVTYEGLLSLNKNNKGKDLDQWEFQQPDDLRKFIDKLIEKNEGLIFLRQIFEEVIKKEDPNEVIQRLNTQLTDYISKNNLSPSEEDETIEPNDNSVTIEEVPTDLQAYLQLHIFSTATLENHEQRAIYQSPQNGK